MVTSVLLYAIAYVEIVGCTILLLATVDLYALSSSQLQEALNIYENVVAEIASEIDMLASDDRLSDPLYESLVTTVATITDPANASVVRQAVYENGLVLEPTFSESAATFESSVGSLTGTPALRDRYAGIVVKAVRAASLWDLALQAADRPFLRVPTWLTNPSRERDLIDRSRYDVSLVRLVLSRLSVADHAHDPLGHAF